MVAHVAGSPFKPKFWSGVAVRVTWQLGFQVTTTMQAPSRAVPLMLRVRTKVPSFLKLLFYTIDMAAMSRLGFMMQ